MCVTYVQWKLLSHSPQGFELSIALSVGLTTGLLAVLLVGIIAIVVIIIIVRRMSSHKQKDASLHEGKGTSSERTYVQSYHPTIAVDQNVAYGTGVKKGMDLEASYVVNQLVYDSVRVQ